MNGQISTFSYNRHGILRAKGVFYFIQSQAFYPYLILRQLIQLDLEPWFIVRSQLGPSIQSGSYPCPGIQKVTRSTHLSKDCYPQLVLNPHPSEIRPLQQLDYRWMPLHPAERFLVLSVLCQELQSHSKREEQQKIQKTSLLQFELPENYI